MNKDSRQRVVFTDPGRVEVHEEIVDEPSAGQVRVRTICSAISPGTERLVYRGKIPEGIRADATIEALQEEVQYPLSYGYACVGTVEAIGAKVDSSWEGRRVFAFQPHVSRFVASTGSLVPLPREVATEDAVMLPTVETAVNLLMDGRPMIGEKVVVFGQGVVGLLTTALLARHPLDVLVTSERSEERRRRSRELGAMQAVDPQSQEPSLADLVDAGPREATEAESEYAGADLVFELSGNPSVLNDALRCTGFGGRIVIGSWYGTKTAPLDLGGRFHRSRIRLIASQVSSIDPAYRGRWTTDRRMRIAVSLLDDLSPSRLITDRFRVSDAPQAYEALEDDEMIQPIFEYE